MLRYVALSGHPRVFKSMTGLHVADFDALVAEVLPALRAVGTPSSWPGGTRSY